jgi:glycosyltransferase involved in cell wall biosynthesis
VECSRPKHAQIFISLARGASSSVGVKAKMRICIIDMPIPVLSPQAVSQISVNAKSYAESFSRLGHRPVVIHATKIGEVKSKESYDKISIQTLQHSSRLGKFVEEILYSLRVVMHLFRERKNGLDLVLSLNYSSVFLLSMIQFGQELMRRTVVMHSGIEPKESLLFGTISVFIKRHSLNKVMMVVAQSTAVKKAITELYSLDPSKIEVESTAGVDTELFRPEDPVVAKKMVGFEEGTKTILCVATIEVRKNQLTLIRAFKNVLANHPECRLVLIGPTAEERYFQKIQELVSTEHMQSKVKILGFIHNHSALVSYYNASDVFALVSLAEGGVPRAVLEAMSCGRACVVSDIPEIEGLAGGTEALLVNPRNPIDLSNALNLLICDQDLRTNLGTRARIRAMGYDWSVLSSGLLRLATERSSI